MMYRAKPEATRSDVLSPRPEVDSCKPLSQESQFQTARMS